VDVVLVASGGDLVDAITESSKELRFVRGVGDLMPVVRPVVDCLQLLGVGHDGLLEELQPVDEFLMVVEVLDRSCPKHGLEFGSRNREPVGGRDRGIPGSRVVRLGFTLPRIPRSPAAVV